jgi:hypothetical protein
MLGDNFVRINVQDETKISTRPRVVKQALNHQPMIHNTKRKLVALGIVLGGLLINFACTSDSRDEFEPPSCDTEQVTYALTIKPILNGSCTGCHGSTNPAGGLDLSSHSGVMTSANDGSLLGSIKHLNGFQPMPRFAPKLQDCDIAKIEKWVNDGALNN